MLSCPPLQLQMSSCLKYSTLNSFHLPKTTPFTSEGGFVSVIGDIKKKNEKKKIKSIHYVVLKRHDSKSCWHSWNSEAWKTLAWNCRFVCVRIGVQQCSEHAVLCLLQFALSLACLLHSFEALILWGLDCLPLLICLMPSGDVELCLLMVQFCIISKTALN